MKDQLFTEYPSGGTIKIECMKNKMTNVSFCDIFSDINDGCNEWYRFDVLKDSSSYHTPKKAYKKKQYNATCSICALEIQQQQTE